MSKFALCKALPVAYDGAVARPSPQTERLVDLVEALVARPDQGLSLTELARHLGVTPATCHPMVAELTRRGWLRRHPARRTYRLGPAFVAIGRAAAGAAETQELARSALIELQQEHKLDGMVLAAGEDVTTIIDLVPDRRGSGLQIGDQVPFRAPLGASIAAWCDEPTIERWLTAGDPPEGLRLSYLELLAAVRGRGYAVELTGTVDARIYEVLAQIGGRFGDGADDPGAARLRTLLDELVGEVGGSPGLPPVRHRSGQHLSGRHHERTGLRPRGRGHPAARRTGAARAACRASRYSASVGAWSRRRTTSPRPAVAVGRAEDRPDAKGGRGIPAHLSRIGCPAEVGQTVARGAGLRLRPGV